ncbi:hypothetical protein BGZ52_012946 [Haplosporangium bisporale]|nr:hypothetical protein BGZ52_012946 [Haplosporangium bisporale]
MHPRTRLWSTLAIDTNPWITPSSLLEHGQFSSHSPATQRWYSSSVTPPPPTPTQAPYITYQEQEKLSQRIYFPELEPAPFPRDIHSTMPYLNRDVQGRKSDANGTITGTHNDLSSFDDLDHNTKSTIYRGTRFEYQTQEILKKRLGIYTQRSAGNNDLGVDLRGTWFLPMSSSPQPGDKVRHLKVIVQCKSMCAKIGPKFVRELQGSLSFETQPTMAILAISSEFTKQALLPYAKSVWPMALVVIDTETNECRKLMWNRAADKVMHGLHVGTKWIPGESGSVESRPVLCYEGKVLERLPGPYLTEDGFDIEIEEFSLSTEGLHWSTDRPDYLDIVPSAEFMETEEEQDTLDDHISMPYYQRTAISDVDDNSNNKPNDNSGNNLDSIPDGPPSPVVAPVSPPTLAWSHLSEEPSEAPVQVAAHQ